MRLRGCCRCPQRGADLGCGLSALTFAPAASDGVLLACLRDAGAVPFVRTNVPQGLLMSEVGGRPGNTALMIWYGFEYPRPCCVAVAGGQRGVGAHD